MSRITNKRRKLRKKLKKLAKVGLTQASNKIERLAYLKKLGERLKGGGN